MTFNRIGALLIICCFKGSANEPPAGTTLQHFTKAIDGITAGSKPKTTADFEFLKSQGVHFLLQPRFLPFFNGSEKKAAKQHGMQYFSVPMNASPIAPSEKHVNAALRIMRTQGYRPLYLHCVLGRDRTSLLVGLYRIYFEGVSKEKAYAEMKAEGFRDTFFLRGLKSYFDKHSKLPAELADLPDKTATANE